MRGTDEVNAVREGGRERERKEEREVKGRREKDPYRIYMNWL